MPSRWRFVEPFRFRLSRGGLSRVLPALALRLEYTQAHDELLGAVAEVVSTELDLPYVRIDLQCRTDDAPVPGDVDARPAGSGVGARPLPEPAAVVGAPVGTTLVLPLTYQARVIGHITYSGDRPGRPPRRSQRRAMTDVVGHLGGALHTARLLADRRENLDRVLHAREEERRRLRHELHDSLGPILAGISLGLHAARRIMPRDPAQADQLVTHLEQELQSAIGEVRRLFETLRPSALDQLGLVAAVQEHIDRLADRLGSGPDQTGAARMSFAMEHRGDFGALPAIVEVAAYRIVCEALTNVARHSAAQTCTVSLRRDTGIQVEVRDDGVGLGSRMGRGLGLGSMRERATELGGSFLIETPPTGGTTVVASLPIHPVPAAP